MSHAMLSRLSDAALIESAQLAVRRERSCTAEVVAHIAEVGARKLHLRAGYSSLRDWCIAALGLSEDAAYKRIHAARASRRVPQLLPMLQSGDLSLSVIVTLAPVLTPKNSRELLASAARKTRAEVLELIAERFPQPDLPTHVVTFDSSVPLAPGRVVPTEAQQALFPTEPESPGAESASANETVETKSETSLPASAPVAIVPRSRTLPLSPGRIAWQTTVDRETHALFEELKALLAHVVPTGDMARVLKRALQVAVEQEKKRRFASGVKCRAQRNAAPTRAIPDAIRQQVFARDGAACTFVGADGRRCGSTWRLELDHVIPVALGGETSVENLRVLCRAHNQYEAERVLGSGHPGVAT